MTDLAKLHEIERRVPAHLSAPLIEAARTRDLPALRAAYSAVDQWVEEDEKRRAAETVPPDVAAALEAFERLVRVDGHEFSRTREADIGTARAALEAAILHHLRAEANYKAALERIERGG